MPGFLARGSEIGERIRCFGQLPKDAFTQLHNKTKAILGKKEKYWLVHRKDIVNKHRGTIIVSCDKERFAVYGCATL